MSEQRIQLFLLPFAGGSAASFHKLTACLDERIEPISIDYAGRNTRRREPYIADYGTFLQDVDAQIRARRNPALPMALFGYSLGSALVYDLVRTGAYDPRLLVLCARQFLAYPCGTQAYAALPKEAFIEKLRRMGGLDERLLANPRFLDIFTEPLRKDYDIWAQFRYHPLSAPLKRDLLVFYSEKDTPWDSVKDWATITTGQTDFYEFGENHFFINQHFEEMASILNGKLAAL